MHANVGRVSNRAKPAEFRKQVWQLLCQNASGGPHERLGPPLAAEHLAQDHGVAVDPETLRRWLPAHGLWSRRRKRQPHQSRRQHKAHFCGLMQLDGSHHDWLEGGGPQVV